MKKTKRLSNDGRFLLNKCYKFKIFFEFVTAECPYFQVKVGENSQVKVGENIDKDRFYRMFLAAHEKCLLKTIFITFLH